MKLNIGCGNDYRQGFINIDGSDTLSKVDMIIDLNKPGILLKHFEESTVEYILANDVVEHFFHWEAVKLLHSFYTCLQNGGKIEIRVPDTEYIIKNWRIPIESKVFLLYGGQDLPQGKDIIMNESREKFPCFFCHKFGYTMQSMKSELDKVGFTDIKCKRAGTNFITYARK